jgi:hypothetical protein
VAFAFITISIAAAYIELSDTRAGHKSAAEKAKCNCAGTALGNENETFAVIRHIVKPPSSMTIQTTSRRLVKPTRGQDSATRRKKSWPV